MSTLPSYVPALEDIDAERMRRAAAREQFHRFVVETHHDYRMTKFHRHIADRLQALANFESRFMQIVLPPRHGKTTLGTRLLSAWLMGRNKNEKLIQTAHTQPLANSFSMDVKRILWSDEYRALYPDTRIPSEGYRGKRRELDKVSEWEVIDSHGLYRAAGTGVGIVGKGYRRIGIDDPIKSHKEAHSERVRDGIWSWYNDELMTRAEYPFTCLIATTRWHRDDLAGRLQREEGTTDEGGKWEVIRYPFMQDSESRPYDDREIGDPLYPEWFLAPWEYLPGTPPPDVSAMPEANEPVQVDMDTLVARAVEAYTTYKGDRDAVLQGNPVAEGGNIIKWFQSWREVPGAHGEWVIFCDPKGGSKDPRSSRAVIQLWFRPHGSADIYLIAQVKGLWDQPETIEVFRTILKYKPWSNATLKFVENKADGKSVVAGLRNSIPGMQEFKLPHMAKAPRYRASAPYWKAGNVWLPPPELCVDPLTGENWYDDFVAEHKDAPSGVFDDQIDTTTMAVFYFYLTDEDGKVKEESAWSGWESIIGGTRR